MSAVAHGQRVEGPIITPTFRILAAVAGVAGLILVWRFLFGLGSTTALNDGYPWGLWIAFDVVVGTAIACGGYAMAILVYVLNKGRYHSLVRSAVLTSGIGYSLAGLAVVIDLGRFWNMWKLPVFFWSWNLTSILLEVALCIMAYTMVVWVELSPAVVERFREEGRPRARLWAERARGPVEKALPWILALGILLPTMHQSSLGSLMLLAGAKLHPLWFTPFLPLLFLITCVGMGFAGVVVESTWSSRAFDRPHPRELLAELARPTAWIMLSYVAIRLVDLAWAGKLSLLLAFDGYALLFLVEMALFVGTSLALLNRGLVRRTVWLVRLAIGAVVAGALYRFSVFLIAYTPVTGQSYFPAVPEILVTAGLIAVEVMIYLALVKTFPILHGRPRRPAPEPS